MTKEYIETKYGFKIHIAYIAEVKRDLGFYYQKGDLISLIPTCIIEIEKVIRYKI